MSAKSEDEGKLSGNKKERQYENTIYCLYVLETLCLLIVTLTLRGRGWYLHFSYDRIKIQKVKYLV